MSSGMFVRTALKLGAKLDAVVDSIVDETTALFTLRDFVDLASRFACDDFTRFPADECGRILVIGEFDLKSSSTVKGCGDVIDVIKKGLNLWAYFIILFSDLSLTRARALLKRVRKSR